MDLSESIVAQKSHPRCLKEGKDATGGAMAGCSAESPEDLPEVGLKTPNQNQGHAFYLWNCRYLNAVSDILPGKKPRVTFPVALTISFDIFHAYSPFIKVLEHPVTLHHCISSSTITDRTII
jgi:hypothetical protein